MGEWFDELARVMARGLTSREALRHVGSGIAAVMVAALLPRPAAAVGCSGPADCGGGELCCEGTCVEANCCDSDDCGGDLCCGGDCTTDECCDDGDCGGDDCCSGSCCDAGEACCDGECCDAGDVCCGDDGCCPAARECCGDECCPPGELCCASGCVEAECCPEDECDGACCDPGALCCGVVCCDVGDLCCDENCCDAGALCCDDNCCDVGAVCCDNTCCDVGEQCCDGEEEDLCGVCCDDGDCGGGEVCCDGTCTECCGDADCDGGDICCNNTYCAGCCDDGNCGGGEVCCDGACVEGECCEHADCGDVCCDGVCAECCEDVDCGIVPCCAGTCCAVGELCCGGDCAACCGDGDCDPGLICEAGTCVVGDVGGGDQAHNGNTSGDANSDPSPGEQVLGQLLRPGESYTDVDLRARLELLSGGDLAVYLGLLADLCAEYPFFPVCADLPAGTGRGPGLASLIRAAQPPTGLQAVFAALIQLQPLSTPNEVTLTLTYNDAELGGLAESGLRVFYYAHALGVWVEVPAVIDPLANTATVPHLDVSAFIQQPTAIGIFG